MKSKKEYQKFVESYTPFSWEINDKEETRNIYSGQHSFEINYQRFFHVFKKLKEIKKILKNPKIIDVGSFPGNMIKLSKYVFHDYSKYISLGLDLDEKYIQEVKKLNVDCKNVEIDPNFPGASETDEWRLENFNLCLLLDTIEHLTNPTFCLDNINKSLKKGGFLLITTDNITNFLYILKMITKGESPNIKFILSSMFYIGNHRPHHREYSKDELIFLLNHSGFEVLSHEYFDRKQGQFFLKNKKLSRNNNFKFKSILTKPIKWLFNLVPHFRNHQIILAKKQENIEDISRPKQTHSKKDWLNLRMKTIGY